MSSNGFTRYSSSLDRVVERFPIPRVYDFFQISFFPMKSAEPSAQERSAALKMMRFRRFNSVTSAFSLVPSGGMKDSLDWAARTVVVFAWRITSTFPSDSLTKRGASSCQQISRLSLESGRLFDDRGSNRRNAWV